MNHHYKVDIRWSDDDQAFIARVPELDGVITHGETVSDAAHMAEEAIALHLESLKAHNEPIPEPIALEKLSGQYPLRMGKERHQDVVLRARQQGKSINEYLTGLIDNDQATFPGSNKKVRSRGLSKARLRKTHRNSVRTPKKSAAKPPVT